ncbi:hypothetical protein PLESTB_000604700 [Pleodorina starrii]|uniref:Pentacotripeptide-repeat region of PRORP domain-containing protein n=1 Tax=Pleodorina starrii TaxID=330485 RepID=A0A9W6BIM2_9CHLO|nr:hypothetical protein PLESTB_000604700 [Pleodorina starrii]
MWHSGQVSQKHSNNQRTPLQQSPVFSQHDAAAAAASASWGRTPLFADGSGSGTGGPQQYAPSGGLLLPAQFALMSPSGQLSGPSLPQQPVQQPTNMSQQQQALLPHRQYQLQGQPVQQPWAAPQAWAGQQQQARQHSQQQRQHVQQQQHLQQHMQHQQQLQLQQAHLQQQQQQLQQQQHQQLQQLQHHSQSSLANPSSGRGWGGQRLPYPRHGSQPADPNPALRQDIASGRGRGRDRYGGGGGSGRGWRGGAGGSGRGGSGGGYSDALIHQLTTAVRQLPRGQSPQDVVAGRLAALDGRGLALLLKQLASGGLVAQAWELFDWLRSLEPGHELARLLDVFPYTAMISLCSSNRRDMEVALALSREMVARGVPRNVHTFSALMNVCIKAGQHQAALDVWRELQDAGCRPNVVTYNTLIDAYGKTGQWTEALKVLARMKEEGMEPVTRTYNTLMIACNSSNQWHEALGVYNQMLATGHAPNTTTYNALITVYSKAGRLEKVMETLREMEAAGCERTVITYSALIAACERDGQWELALQMFSQMLREGCIPNIITYNSLITALAAGAQWERAADVFVQLQRQGCEPDVVTYTALINAYQKGGQWRRALQTFNRMLQQGCRADHVVFSAVVDALWDSGVAAAQARAARINRAAMASGYVKPIATTSAAAASSPTAAAAAAVAAVAPSAVAGRAGSAYSAVAAAAAAEPSAAGPAAAAAGDNGGGAGEVRELHLAALATGSAVVTFLMFLADQRERVIELGPDAALPPRVILRFSRSRGGRDSAASLPLRDALHNWLQTRGSPFRLVQDSLASAAQRLEAAGSDLAAWLLEDAVAVELVPYVRGGSAAALAAGIRDPLTAAMDGCEDELVQDAELETACRDAYEQVRRFEATHCLSVASMGAAYIARRRDLAANLLRVAASLQLSADVAHDAVLLLDRLMSAAPQLREDLFAMASVTALRVLAAAPPHGDGAGGAGGSGGARGGGGGGGGNGRSRAQEEAELDARLAQITGLPTLGFQSMELNIHSALGGDTAAISAMRCLRLYMRRLGWGDECLMAPEEELRLQAQQTAGGGGAAVSVSGPSLAALVDQTLHDSEFLNYRPSATAAAVLYCHRLRRGNTPLWPAAVALLTGYADLEHPELAAAVGAVQRLFLELSTAGARGAASSSGGGGSTSGATSGATAQMTALLGGS